MKKVINDTPFLERAIEIISPRWAYNRAAWRLATRGVYEASDSGRFGIRNGTQNYNAELLNRPERDKIRYNAQQLERNSDILQSILHAYKRNVVGVGFKLQAKIKNKEELDENKNNTVEGLWKEWSKPVNCDITAMQSFPEMCGMSIERYLVDGGIFFIRTETKGGLIPFKLQMREVSELNEMMQYQNPDNGNQIISGIEIDKYNKAIAYHFKKQDASGLTSNIIERIPAERVIFWAHRSRPTEVREISPLAPLLPRINQTEKYMQAVLLKAQLAACSGLVITSAQPIAGIGRGVNGTTTDAQSGYGQETITPGMIMNLKPGEDAKVIQATQDGTQSKDYISTNQRLVGSSVGLSYESTSRDMSQTNYSSARQGRLEDGAEFDMMVESFNYNVLDVVYKWFFDSIVLTGLLSLPVETYQKYESFFQRHSFIAPSRPWIDPYKEAKANEIILDQMNPQNTLANVCQSMGLDWREVVEQRTIESKYLNDLRIAAGLPIINTITGGPFDVNASGN